MFIYTLHTACSACAIIPISSPYMSVCVINRHAVRLLYQRDDCQVASGHGIQFVMDISSYLRHRCTTWWGRSFWLIKRHIRSTPYHDYFMSVPTPTYDMTRVYNDNMRWCSLCRPFVHSPCYCPIWSPCTRHSAWRPGLHLDISLVILLDDPVYTGTSHSSYCLTTRSTLGHLS
jgi:hypothetical protein